MKFHRVHVFSLLLALALLLIPVSPLLAASLQLSSARSSYGVGESFLVMSSLNTEGALVNTVSGTVVVPAGLAVSDVRYGNSIIVLWIDKPAYNPLTRAISFTGGIPGGYAGSYGPLFSFVASAGDTGTVSIAVENPKLLLNDGQGTAVPNVRVHDLTVTIEKALERPPAGEPLEGVESPKVEQLPADTTPPEAFVPSVASDPAIADGQWFASFNAVDKDAGVSRYEAYEAPLFVGRVFSGFDKDWAGAVSPYIIRSQFWPSRIVIRAFDQAGNTRDGEAYTPTSAGFIALVVATSLLLGALLAGAFFFRRRRNRRLL